MHSPWMLLTTSDTVFGFKYKRILSTEVISETKDGKKLFKVKMHVTQMINLEDKCQPHSKPRDCLVSKEFLSIHQILHPESIDLSTQTHTGSLSLDSVIPPTLQNTIQQLLNNHASNTLKNILSRHSMVYR